LSGGKQIPPESTACTVLTPAVIDDGAWGHWCHGHRPAADTEGGKTVPMPKEAASATSLTGQKGWLFGGPSNENPR